MKSLLVACGAGASVVLLDSMMTFPFRLPSHFACLMLFLSCPARDADPAVSA